MRIFDRQKITCDFALVLVMQNRQIYLAINWRTCTPLKKESLLYLQFQDGRFTCGYIKGKRPTQI